MASKSYRKFMATGLSAAVVASVVAPVAGAAAYDDVKEGAWYEEAINYVTEMEYMKGTGKGFEPGSDMTRAQAAQLFTNILGLETEGLKADFSDVKEGAWYYEAIAAVNENGVMKGSGSKFEPNGTLTRGQMAAIIVRAYDLGDHEGRDHSFTDIEGNMFATEIAILADLGIVDGMVPGKFAPNAPVTRAQMAAFIMKTEVEPVLPVIESVKAVDTKTVEVTVDGAWTQEQVDALVEAGYELTVEGKASHKVGKVTVKAAEASASADTTTLVLSGIAPELVAGEELSLAVNGEKVEGSDFKYTAPVVTPEVTSVSANNLKVVTVNFNQEVDEDSIDFTSVKVKKGSTTYTDSDLNYVLLDDKKTLAIEFDTVSNLQSDELSITVDGVETANKAKVTKFEGSVTFKDTVTPSVTAVKVVNPKVLEIHTSEPIQLSAASFTSLSSIKIDGVNVIAKVTPDYVNNKYTVELNSVLTAGQHKVSVSELKDFANFKADSAEFTVTVVEDSTAPTVTSAKVVDKDTVEVKFSEALAVGGSTPVGTFKINGATYVPTLKSGTVDTIVIDALNPVLDLGALVEINFDYVGVKDVIGNEVKETVTYKFKADDDTAVPSVSASLLTAAGKLNNLELTFSKGMLTNVGTVELKDKDNKVVASLSASDADWTQENKVATFTASELSLNNVNPGSYTLTLKSFKDSTLRGNQLATTTVTLNAVDTKVPTVNANYLEVKAESASEKPQIRVSFSEAMDPATLNNLANYHVGTGTTTFSGSRLDQLTGAKIVSVASDNKSVVIELPSTSYDETTGNATTVKVEGIRDLAGNLVAPSVVSSAKGLSSLAVTDVSATGENTIVVTFDREIGLVDPSVFTVQNEDDVAITNISNAVISSTNARKVTLTTVGKLPHNLVKDTKALELDIASSTKIKDVYNTAFAGVLNHAIVDGISSVASLDTDTAGNLVIDFSEAVEVASFAGLESDLIIRDEDGVIVDLVDADEVTASAGAKTLNTVLSGGASDDVASFETITLDLAAGSYTVELISRNVTDDNKTNKVKAIATKTITIK